MNTNNKTTVEAEKKIYKNTIKSNQKLVSVAVFDRWCRMRRFTSIIDAVDSCPKDWEVIPEQIHELYFQEMDFEAEVDLRQEEMNFKAAADLSQEEERESYFDYVGFEDRFSMVEAYQKENKTITWMLIMMNVLLTYCYLTR